MIIYSRDLWSRNSLGQMKYRILFAEEPRIIRAMTPEFYLVLKDRDLSDQLADAVFEAGFDDCSLTMRSNHAAVWVRDRDGEFFYVVKDALTQARNGDLNVLHIEIEKETFA